MSHLPHEEAPSERSVISVAAASTQHGDVLVGGGGPKSPQATAVGLIGVILNYVFAQGAGFLIQALAMALAGPMVSGAFGLALLAVNLTILLGDLGYSMHFLRAADVGSPEWLADWRTAQGHRVVFLCLVTVVMALAWPLAYGSASLSWAAMIVALPAIGLSYFNFSAVLFAQGHMSMGNVGRLFAAVPMLVVGLLVLLLARPFGPKAVAVGLGAAVTVGQLVQAIFYLVMTRRLKLYKAALLDVARYVSGRASEVTVRRQRRILAIGGRLWSIILIGTAHGAVPAFLIAGVWPSFLPYQLLVQSALTGATGVQEQTLRALTPLVTRSAATGGRLPLSLPVISTAVSTGLVTILAFGLAGLVAVGLGKFSINWALYLPALLLIFLEWIANNLTQSALPVVLARHAEGVMLKGVLAANSGAGILTVAIVVALYWLNLPRSAIAIVFVVRAATACGVSYYLWRHLKLDLTAAYKELLLPGIGFLLPSVLGLGVISTTVLLFAVAVAAAIWIAVQIRSLLCEVKYGHS